MKDYAVEIAGAAARAPAPVAVCGWSMGGLATMMYARDARVPPARLVLLEPSPPGEVQGFDANATLATGRFDPEQVYGPFPPGIRSRPESALARSERKQGISVPSLPCRTLVVYGREFPDNRGRRLARHYGAEELEFPDLGHWGLILDRRVPLAIASWLGAQHGLRTRFKMRRVEVTRGDSECAMLVARTSSP
jgi:pimeloyl-ACP methyl ester carboxylesterase